MQRAGPLARIGFALTALIVGGTAVADPVDDARQEAALHASRGELLAAAAALAPLVDAYAEDWTVAADWARIEYAEGHYLAAEQGYRIALQRAPAATDAELGLAWALLRQDRCGEALSHFEIVRRTREGDRSARDGEEACRARRPAQAWVTLAPRGAVYSGDPDKTAAIGFDASARVLLIRHLSLSGAYGYTRYLAEGTAFPGFDHHELHLHLGYESTPFSFTLRGAFVFDGSDTVG